MKVGKDIFPEPQFVGYIDWDISHIETNKKVMFLKFTFFRRCSIF